MRWFIHIDLQINKLLSEARFTRYSDRSSFGVDYYSQVGKHRLDHYQHLHTPPPESSCTSGYNPSLDHLMMKTDTLILGDFNAHHSSWHSSSTYSRGTMLESIVSGSNFGHFYQLVEEDEPMLRPSTNPHYFVDGPHYQPDTTSFQYQPEKENWDRYSKEIEDKLSKRRLPTNCRKAKNILRVIILKAASHHIPYVPHQLNTEPVPTEILEKR